MVLKKKAGAHGLWTTLEELFRTNKEHKATQLRNQLRNITMGELPVNDYCTNIKGILDMLENLGSSVPKRNLVSYTMSDLTQKSKSIVNTIRYSDTAENFMKARAILVMEEEQMELDQARDIHPPIPIIHLRLLFFSLTRHITPPPTARFTNIVEAEVVVETWVGTIILFAHLLVNISPHRWLLELKETQALGILGGTQLIRLNLPCLMGCCQAQHQI